MSTFSRIQALANDFSVDEIAAILNVDALEVQNAIGGGPVPEVPSGGNERTVYTLGPASGEYDIAWDSEDAVPEEGDEPQIVVQGGVAFLQGTILFGGPLGFLGTEEHPALLPIGPGNDWRHRVLVSASTDEWVQVRASGSLGFGRVDGTDFEESSSVQLSGSYLVGS